MRSFAVLAALALGGCDRLFAHHEKRALEADEALRAYCKSMKPGDRVEQRAPFTWTRTEQGFDVTGGGYARCIVVLDGERVMSASWLPD